MGRMPVTRGFTGRRRDAGRADQLPPGQYDAGSDWPSLTAEATPMLAEAGVRADTIRVEQFVASGAAPED